MSLPPEGDLGTVRFRPPVPYRKFRDRKWLHLLLFLLTLASTTFVGRDHYLSYAADFSRRNAAADLFDGLWYSLTILGILGAHEFGHYIMCRRYNVDASLPYFIPLLFPCLLYTSPSSSLTPGAYLFKSGHWGP